MARSFKITRKRPKYRNTFVLSITYSKLHNIQPVGFVLSKLGNKNDISQIAGDVTNKNISLLTSYFRNKCV